MLRLLTTTVAWMVACAAVFTPGLPGRSDRALAVAPAEDHAGAEITFAAADPLEPPPRFEAAGYPPAYSPSPATDTLTESEGFEGFSEIPGSGEARPPLTDGIAELQGDPPSLTANLTIPSLALTAYRRAESRSSSLSAGCYVPWQVLAGIGMVESGHGSFGGGASSLAPDGTFDRPILGPQLTGGPGIARIRDTDGGMLDQDTAFDRAVGPMQFIPSSWQRYGQDGNDDGRVDPNNLFDAALAAAAHLCHTVPADYRTDTSRLAQAIYGYNRSASYVARVLGWVNAYRGIDGPPSDIPEPVAPITPPSLPDLLPEEPTAPRRPVAQGPSTPKKQSPAPKPTKKPASDPTPSVTPTPKPTAPPTTPPPTLDPGEEQPSWQPPAVEFSVTGLDTKRPERLRAPALVGYIQRLVAATNAGDADALITLLDGVEDPEAAAAALIADRKTNGELAPGLIKMVYPKDVTKPVMLTTAVWRNPDSLADEDVESGEDPATDEDATTDEGAEDDQGGASADDEAVSPYEKAVEKQQAEQATSGTGRMLPWTTMEVNADGALASLKLGGDDDTDEPAEEPTAGEPSEPTTTPTPEPTPTPTATATPTPATSSSPTTSPAATATPTPAPTTTPEQTATPAPTATPGTKATSTPASKATATPQATSSPLPSNPPSPEESPTPAETTAPAATPAPSPTPSPTPTPNPTPTLEQADEQAEPEWTPPAVRFSVEGTDARRPDGLKAPALVDYVGRLVAATNAAEVDTLTALLDGAENPTASAEALIKDRQAGGELAPALITIVYPENLQDPVEVTVDVWRRPVTEDADASSDARETQRPWATFELTAEGDVGVLTMDYTEE